MRFHTAALAAIATAGAGLVATTLADAHVDSASARIYLHPASQATKGKEQAAAISPIQLNSILAHHFDVPGEVLGTAASDRAAWDWLPQQAHAGQEAVSRLFGKSKQRTAVIVTGMSDADADEIMPASLRHTHEVLSAPHISSFENLLHLYGDRLFDSMSGFSQTFEGFLSRVSAKALGAMRRTSKELLECKEAALRQTAAAEQAASASAASPTKDFYESLLTLIHHIEKTGDAQILASEPYHALRIDGLAEMRATYGEDSAAFKDAKRLLQRSLAALADALNGSQDESEHRLAFVVMPGKGGQMALEKRGDPIFPFRGQTVSTPFLTTRSESGDLDARQESTVSYLDADVFGVPSRPTIAKKPSESDSPKQPKERDYIGKCFTSEDDLNSATANCFGHGNATQTSKGGRQCYRCKCQATTGKNGKITQWAGDACQKIDISKEFVLLGTTGIALLVTIMGSVLYLYYEGEQELPSVLAGISIPNK